MTSPLSAVSSAPWWLTLPTGTLLAAFISGHSKPVIMWLWHRFVFEAASAETRETRLAALSMQMVDQGQEDARDLRRDLALARSEAEAERKRADAERASGQNWYYIARAWENAAHDMRHNAVNFCQMVHSLRPDAVLVEVPRLPPLEDIEK